MSGQQTIELIVERDGVSAHSHTARDGSDSSPASPRRRSRRTKWSPPASLQDHFRRKGYLSVTELTSPSWCEYNYQYSVLGALSTLPASERPAAITTPDGATLQPSLVLVEEKERVLDKGKAVHAQLEWEAQFGDTVEVKPETKEDLWAARLLDMWCKLQWLRKGGVVREFDLCGWVEGELVRGVVDEIVRRPLDLDGARSQGASGATEADQQRKDKDKVWASQEDWKRDQMRKTKKPKASKDDEVAKTPTLEGFGFTSPRKKKAKSPSPSGSQTSAVASAVASPAVPEVSSTPPPPPPNGSQPAAETIEPNPSDAAASSVDTPWGYFLSDTKTRISASLPAEEDQTQARRQCMIYKRLFDGLCLGALASQRDQGRYNGPTASFDPHATPMRWLETLHSLSLSTHTALSSGFLASALPLAESWGCDLLSLPSLRTETDSDSRLAANDPPLDAGCTLSDLVRLFERGLCTLIDEVLLQPHLTTPAEVIQSRLSLRYIHQPPRLSRNSKRSAARPRRHDRATTRTELGTVSFEHDGEALQAFLVDALELWRGRREMRGVAVHETRRCWRCVWMEGCEWRAKMANRAFDPARLVTVGQEQGGDGGGGGGGDVDVVDDCQPRSSTTQNLPLMKTIDGEEEEQLWSQFGEIDDADLPQC